MLSEQAAYRTYHTNWSPYLQLFEQIHHYFPRKLFCHFYGSRVCIICLIVILQKIRVITSLPKPQQQYKNVCIVLFYCSSSSKFLRYKQETYEHHKQKDFLWGKDKKWYKLLRALNVKFRLLNMGAKLGKPPIFHPTHLVASYRFGKLQKTWCVDLPSDGSGWSRRRC